MTLNNSISLSNPSSVQSYDFHGTQVRIVLLDDEPYFVGKDVAGALGYKKPRNALISHVDSEDKKVAPIQGVLGGTQDMTIINESGMYSLILSSQLPQAKEFKRWVTNDILPAIRKNGAYILPQILQELVTSPDLVIELASQVKQEREGRLIAEQQVNEMQPKVSYYDLILANKSLVTITQIAKDYGMSGRKFNSLLHDFKIQFKQGKTWFLYSKYQHTGWTQSETRIITTNNGIKKTVMNTKWTQKGRLGLYQFLKERGILPLIEQKETGVDNND